MIQQFAVPPELQQFLSGLQSPALLNVIWDFSFPSGAPELPTNPNTVRRSLLFDRSDGTEFQVYLANVDGSNEQTVTVPRGI